MNTSGRNSGRSDPSQPEGSPRQGSFLNAVGTFIRGETAAAAHAATSAAAILGLPMGPEEPPLAPRQVPGADPPPFVEAVPSDSVTNASATRHPLARDAKDSVFTISPQRGTLPGGKLQLSPQVVLQEMTVDGKGKVNSRLKYVSIRDLFQYIDRLVSLNETEKNESIDEDVKRSILHPAVQETSPEERSPPKPVAEAVASRRGSVSSSRHQNYDHILDLARLTGPGPRRTTAGGGAGANPLSAFVWIHPRDLRKLSANYSLSNNSSVLVRKHVVLMNFDPLRCIVLHDRILLLVPDGADSVLLTLERRLEEFCKPMSDVVVSALDHDRSTPFELSAIEAVLSTVASILNDEYKKLEPVVSETLTALHNNNLHYAQDRLKFVKNNIDAETTRVENMKNAVILVLDDDVDMAMMQLSKIRDNPEKYSIPISPEIIEDHDAVEILLEAYLQSFSTLQTKLSLLDQQIDNTEESVILKLDLARNRLLTIDTMISVVSCGIAFGSMIAGIFGMNLRNGHEDSIEAFQLVIIVTVVVIAVSVSIMGVYLFRSGLLNL